jgi:hypothetical protein
MSALFHPLPIQSGPCLVHVDQEGINEELCGTGILHLLVLFKYKIFQFLNIPVHASVRAKKELQIAWVDFKHLGRGREYHTTCSTISGIVLKAQGFFWESWAGHCTRQQHLKCTPGQNVTHMCTHSTICTATITIPLEKLHFSPSPFLDIIFLTWHLIWTVQGVNAYLRGQGHMSKRELVKASVHMSLKLWYGLIPKAL